MTNRLKRCSLESVVEEVHWFQTVAAFGEVRSGILSSSRLHNLDL